MIIIRDLSTIVLFLTLLATSTLDAADPLPPIWLPQHLDDWTALSAEAKAFVADAAQKKPRPFFSSACEPILRVMIPELPTPPSTVAPEDVIQVVYTVDTPAGLTVAAPGAPGGVKTSCGATTVWRGASGGAVAVTVYFDIEPVAKFLPAGTIKPKAVRPALIQRLATLKPPVGKWDTSIRTDTACAVWTRPGDRARTRDDAEGRAADLRPEDLLWLSTAPKARAPQPAPAMDADAYAKAVAGHGAVQAALARIRAGLFGTPVRIKRVDAGGQAEALGLHVGDLIDSIDNARLHGFNHFDEVRSQCGPAGQTLHVITTEGKTKSVLAKTGLIGVNLYQEAPHPGVAVLVAVDKLGPEALLHAAVVMYALDRPDLMAYARKKIPATCPVAALVLMDAWIASANEDFGRADSILATQVVGASPELAAEIAELRLATRARSGRLLWAWPERAKDAETLEMLRHILKSTLPADRFPVFDGLLNKTTFTVPADDRAEKMACASRLFGATGGTLESNPATPMVFALLGASPTRSELTVQFTIEPTINGASAGGAMEAYLSITGAFYAGSKSMPIEGCGEAYFHASGHVTFRPATLCNSDFTELKPVPVLVAHDGKTPNTLRVLQIGQMQRLEVNGHLVVQGFIPSPPNKALKSAIFIEANGVRCRFTDTRLMAAPDPVPVSNF